MNEIAEKGYENGWLFGKYTIVSELSDDLLKQLDNSDSAIVEYMKNFNLGFNAGRADTKRGV